MTSTHIWERAARIGAAAALATSAAGSAQAQLPYNRTTFLHGTNSESLIWRAPWPELSGLSTPQYLAQRGVRLRDVGTPDLDKHATYLGQRQNLLTFMGAPESQDQHVLVGHSLGGLIARGTYAARPHQVTGIIAVATPHQGLYTADSNEKVLAYFQDLERRVESGRLAAKQIGSYLNIFGIAVIPAIVGYFLYNGGSGISTQPFQEIARLPVIVDQRTRSAVIDSSAVVPGGLARYTGDAGIARANVVGQVPYGHAVLRLAAAATAGDRDSDREFAALKKKKDGGVSGLRKCARIGYFTIVMSDAARRCNRASDALAALDRRWAGFVNGTQYGLAGYRPAGFGYTPVYGQVPRIIPGDGLVPHEQSRYPGIVGDQRFNFTADTANHQNIYRVRRGVDRIADAMLGIGMTSQ